MPSNQHRNLTGDQLHNPKGFDEASASTMPIKNAAGELEWRPNLSLTNALDYVSGQSAPPTEVDGDVYLIDDTGTAYDIDTIAWQSDNTVRYTFNGSPDLSAVAAADYFITSGNTNSSNDGTFVISAVDNSTKYIEVTNVLREDATDDEATDAIGTGYYTLAEWDGVSKGSHVSFDGVTWTSVNAADGAICFDLNAQNHRIYDTTGTNWDTTITSGGITGSGTSNQVAYFSGASALTSSSKLTFDGTTFLVDDGAGANISYDGNSFDVTDGADNLIYWKNNSDMIVESTGNTASVKHAGQFKVGRGNLSTPAVSQASDALWAYAISPYDSSTYTDAAKIEVNATELHSASALGVEYKIQTVSNGSTTLTDRIVVNGDGNVNIGNYKFDIDQTVGAGQDNYVLTYDNATGLITLEAAAGGGLTDVVDDTTPQLGGNLDVNGNKIVSVSNGDIDIEPNGTGNVLLGNMTFDADQTIGAGQDDYVLTYDNATGLISLEASAGGGTSYFTETANAIALDTGATTRDVLEINTGTATTYGGTYTQGNIVVGDGHTFGSGANTVRRAGVGGNSCLVGTLGAYQNSFTWGTSNTVSGNNTGVFGSSNTHDGDTGFSAGTSNVTYGNSNINLGSSNNMGTAVANISNSVCIGTNVDSYGSSQILIGAGFSTNASWGAEDGIYFGIGAVGRATAGFFQDPGGATSLPANFAVGGNQVMRTDLGVVKSGAGSGLIYLQNYNNSNITEPTTDLADAVALYAKDRTAGQSGLVVKSEDGTKHMFADSVGINTVTPDANAALDVEGVIKAKSYTVATVPTAVTGGIIYVSDETGGATLAFSDGTNWRRTTDLAIVS